MTKTRRLLAKVRGRLAIAAAVEDVQNGLAVGGLAALLGLVVRAFGWVDFDPWLALVAALSVALAFPLVGVLARRRRIERVASTADLHLGLEERLSTALRCERNPTVMADLVRGDADHSAGTVTRATLRSAFRPRVLRRQLILAVAAAGACALVMLYQPTAEAAESSAQRAARLADENRIARVARKLREETKRLEAEAKKKKMPVLAGQANRIRRQAESLISKPPPRQEALSKLNDLRDAVKASMQKAAGAKRAMAAPEADKAGKALAQLLKDMAAAGIESVERDLSDLAQRLRDGESGTNPPSADEIRALAARIDALRRAIEQAEAGATGEALREQLRSFGNEDLLEKIAQRLRDLASKIDQGQGYEQLQAEGGEFLDMSQLSREELEELLRQLDELHALDSLQKLLQQASGSCCGGRRLRLGGSGGT